VFAEYLRFWNAVYPKYRKTNSQIDDSSHIMCSLNILKEYDILNPFIHEMYGQVHAVKRQLDFCSEKQLQIHMFIRCCHILWVICSENTHLLLWMNIIMCTSLFQRQHWGGIQSNMRCSWMWSRLRYLWIIWTNSFWTCVLFSTSFV
jgi:hypothetical protein